MKCILLFFLIPLLCYSQSKKDKEFILIGKITGFTEGSIFHLYNIGKENKGDSAILQNNEIRFTGLLKEPGVYRLQIKNDLYSIIWLEEGVINLEADSSSFFNCVIKNSKVNDDDKIIHDILNPLYSEEEYLINLIDTSSNQTHVDSLKIKYKALSDSIKQIRVTNLFNLSPSYPLLQELFFLRNTISKDSVRLAYNRFPALFKESDNGLFLANFINTNDLKIGDTAPEIIGKNLNGDEVKLSDFRGKIVLLDFWASWCSPCRKSNKQLAILYNNYKNKSFEILSFNMDKSLDKWKNASKKDNINWANISDLAAHYSPVAITYNIQSLPKAFLINEKGEIVELLNGYSPQNDDIILKYLNKL